MEMLVVEDSQGREETGRILRVTAGSQKHACLGQTFRIPNLLMGGTPEDQPSWTTTAGGVRDSPPAWDGLPVAASQSRTILSRGQVYCMVLPCMYHADCMHLSPLRYSGTDRAAARVQEAYEHPASQECLTQGRSDKGATGSRFRQKKRWRTR
jgi:hypothetical protein